MTQMKTVITKRMAQKIDRGSHQVVGKPPKVAKPPKATQADLKKVSKKDSKKKK